VWGFDGCVGLQERHLYSRTNFKLNRAAALAERLLFLSSIRTCGITKRIRGEQKPFAASA
tara:strand:+ start:522 stop:701 length:180 start_codon:yes stop_codon:yes gene_type:complete